MASCTDELTLLLGGKEELETVFNSVQVQPYVVFIAEALLQVGFIFSRSELKRNLKLKGDVPKEKAAALRNVAWQKLSLQGLSV